MNTTSLLVEMLVSGAVALVWALPLAERIAPARLDTLLNTSAPAMWALGAGLLYTLGLIVNFLADRAVSPLDRRVALPFGGKQRLQKLRAQVLLLDSPAAEYLLQRRGIVRVYRSTVLNAVLVAAVWGLGVAPESLGMAISRWLIGLAALGVATVSVWAFVTTLGGYYRAIVDFTKELDERIDQEATAVAGAAAAD